LRSFILLLPRSYLVCRFSVSLFFSQLSLISCSKDFLVALSVFSFSVILLWMGIHISLIDPFVWFSSSLIRVVFGFWVVQLPSVAIMVLSESVAMSVDIFFLFEK
jgi:hypothetical protein